MMKRESYSNAIGDYNNDGKPDIVVRNDNEDKFFMGEYRQLHANNWIKSKVRGS